MTTGDDTLLEAFQAPGEWLKGNLHTHSTNSDGTVTPEGRVAGYKERGYDFIAFADHSYVTRYSDDDLTVIPGSEWGVRLNDRGCHLVALNVPAGFQLFEDLAMQESVDEVRSAGGIAIIAHPYWTGLTLPDMQDTQGCLGIEIYNHMVHRAVAKGLATVHWDNLLAASWKCLGFAVDDCHSAADAYGGWIMVKSQYRDADSIIEAIKAGKFYSSTGPSIISVEKTDDRLRVECSDAAAINFICREWSGRHIEAPDGEVLNSAEYSTGSQQGYVRVEVIDAKGKAAWTNPLFLS